MDRKSGVIGRMADEDYGVLPKPRCGSGIAALMILIRHRSARQRSAPASEEIRIRARVQTPEAILRWLTIPGADTCDVRIGSDVSPRDTTPTCSSTPIRVWIWTRSRMPQGHASWSPRGPPGLAVDGAGARGRPRPSWPVRRLDRTRLVLQGATSTEITFPAGSLNHAISGPVAPSGPMRAMPFSSVPKSGSV